MSERRAEPGTVTITPDEIVVEGWMFFEMTMDEGREVALRWAAKRLAAVRGTYADAVRALNPVYYSGDDPKFGAPTADSTADHGADSTREGERA